MDKKKSTTFERKVEGYLKPTNHAYINTYVEVNKCSKSAAMNDAVKALREKTPLQVVPVIQK